MLIKWACNLNRRRAWAQRMQPILTPWTFLDLSHMRRKWRLSENKEKILITFPKARLEICKPIRNSKILLKPQWAITLENPGVSKELFIMRESQKYQAHTTKQVKLRCPSRVINNHTISWIWHPMPELNRFKINLKLSRTFWKNNFRLIRSRTFIHLFRLVREFVVGLLTCQPKTQNWKSHRLAFSTHSMTFSVDLDST